MKFFYRICWSIVRLYMILCKVHIKGAENIPKKGSVIIASNHIGAADPPFVGGSINRELFFLAKMELFKNPLLGFLFKNLNCIPVNRGVFDQKALDAAQNALRKEYGLILFPEGTRSKTGELKKGKPGIGLLARKTLVPVVPAYIENSREFLQLPFSRRRLRVTFGEPLGIDWIEKVPNENEGYRLIAEEVMNRISRLKSSGNDKA